MVAYQGLIEFDAEYRSNAQARARAHTGEGLDLMRCHGRGTVYFANLAQHVHFMEVEQDGLTVDSSYVLAMDSSGPRRPVRHGPAGRPGAEPGYVRS